MKLTIGKVNRAIATALGDAAGIVRVHDASNEDASEGGISEGMPDLPALQVYWENLETDAVGDTDRRTFSGKVKTTKLTYHADVYAKQRGILAEDMAKVLEVAEAVQIVLEAQSDADHLFGEEHIRALHWTAQRVTFDYSGNAYAGIRFVIEVWVY